MTEAERQGEGTDEENQREYTQNVEVTEGVGQGRETKGERKSEAETSDCSSPSKKASCGSASLQH